MAGFGAFVLGRNMFGPVRGEWPDERWRGWWGDDPPYHAPVFVLTHHARQPVEMAGGTVFHFVTDGIEAALDRARSAAGALDVKVGGGVSTVRQYLEAGRIDELHLAISPVVLGRGEALFAGIDLPALGFKVTEHIATEHATHVVLGRQGGPPPGGQLAKAGSGLRRSPCGRGHPDRRGYRSCAKHDHAGMPTMRLLGAAGTSSYRALGSRARPVVSAPGR
jgi:dihydrofolate reductase